MVAQKNDAHVHVPHLCSGVCFFASLPPPHRDAEHVNVAASDVHTASELRPFIKEKEKKVNRTCDVRSFLLLVAMHLLLLAMPLLLVASCYYHREQDK